MPLAHRGPAASPPRVRAAHGAPCTRALATPGAGRAPSPSALVTRCQAAYRAPAPSSPGAQSFAPRC